MSFELLLTRIIADYNIRCWGKIKLLVTILVTVQVTCYKVADYAIRSPVKSLNNDDIAYKIT